MTIASTKVVVGPQQFCQCDHHHHDVTDLIFLIRFRPFRARAVFAARRGVRAD
jgi:hypothetical protein